MTRNKIYWESLGAEAQYSIFKPEGKNGECHVIMHVEPRHDLFAGQLERLRKAENLLMQQEELKCCKPVMKRYFLSDATNQAPLLENSPSKDAEIKNSSNGDIEKQEGDSKNLSIGDQKAPEGAYAVSNIQQPPLNGSKIGLWIYLVDDAEVSGENGAVVVRHNGYEHIWKMGMMTNIGNSYEQTASLLKDYEEMLGKFDANIADHCIRTWFYVRDVDIQYHGLVKARRENFIDNGLTPDTHYISSTGIAGVPSDPKAIIQLGAYAIKGLQPDQQHYLYALSHLNKTIEYGVTFERGTIVNYGDRDHAYISGTASIDNKGQVVHIGDVVKQTERMWENVSKLLEEGGMTMDDIMQIIVYLRDSADYAIVKEMFEEKFPDTPFIITLAPVCRPTWLIEMECIAIKAQSNDRYKDF